ncbi:thioesterase domain-containing protein [Rhizobium sp. PAMB 3182]
MYSRRAILSYGAALAATAILPGIADAKAVNGQIYLIRGLANIFSTGLDALGRELKKQGIPAEVVSLRDSDSFASQIASRYQKSKAARPVILIGHSFGADEAYAVAAALKKRNVPVALIVTFDPTGQGPVPSNVRRVLNFYTGSDALWAPVKAAPDFRGKLSNINLRKGNDAIKGIGHFNVDNNEQLHARTVKEIKAVLRIR